MFSHLFLLLLQLNLDFFVEVLNKIIISVSSFILSVFSGAKQLKVNLFLIEILKTFDSSNRLKKLLFVFIVEIIFLL